MVEFSQNVGYPINSLRMTGFPCRGKKLYLSPHFRAKIKLQIKFKNLITVQDNVSL